MAKTCHGHKIQAIYVQWSIELILFVQRTDTIYLNGCNGAKYTLVGNGEYVSK